MVKKTKEEAVIALFVQRLAQLTKEAGEVRDKVRTLIDDAEALFESFESGVEDLENAKMHLESAADTMSQYA